MTASRASALMPPTRGPLGALNAARFQFALGARYLLGRPLRSSLTTLAVIFGVAVFFSLSLLTPAMSEAYRQNLLMSTGQVDLSVSHVSGASFAPSNVDTVRGTPGVAHATGMLRRNALLPSGTGGAPATVNALSIVGVDPATAYAVRSYALTAGRLLADSDADAALLPSRLAEKLGLSVGDTLILPSAAGTARLRVVGLLNAPPTVGAEDVYLPLGAAQRIFDAPGQINAVEAVFATSTDRSTVAAAVQNRLGSAYRLGELESGGEMQTAIQAGQAIYGVFGFMALLMGSFIIHNTFRTVVAERRHDFGMLRAVGASRRTILGMTLAESVTQGLVGTAIGLVLGYLMAAGMIAGLGAITEQFMRAHAVLPSPTVGSLASALLLGVGITVAGALLPAFAATRVTPMEALRPTPESTAARAARWSAIAGAALLAFAALGLVSRQAGLASLGAVFVLVGLVLVAPAVVRPVATLFGRLLELAFAREGQIAQGNLARQPDRAAITASTMMVGLAIGVALLSTITSLVAGFSGYLDRSFGARYLLMPASILLGGGNVGAGPELARRLRETPGVGTVTSLRHALADAVAPGGAAAGASAAQFQLIGIDPQTFPLLSGLIFSQGDPGQAYAAVGRERALIMNSVLALQLRARPGDTVTLRSAEGERSYRVVGVGLDYLNAKLATGYVSHANLAADFHATTDLLLMADPAPGADPSAVRRAIERVAADYPAFSLVDSSTFKDSQIALFRTIQYAMYALLVAVTLPGLIGMINTLAINVIERTREIGTLRAVGMTRTQVRRMILGESLLLAALGTALGILAGIWLGYVLVLGVSAIGYGGGGMLSYELPWAGALVAIAIGLLVGVVAALIPARQAARLPIVAALRYE
ncbi:MAG TPA: FtsX-like permease family protein [Chloroflexota bacterium]|nr:FtsX-like permease family protein [Chloroflexota bacterium]